MSFIYEVKNTDSGGLNSIVQKYGFKNYKEAGITSVPSGNFDLIRAGDKIEIPNYDPNKINTIQPTSPVISSKDQQQSFVDNSKKVDDTLNSLTNNLNNKNNTDINTVKDPFGTGTKNDKGEITSTGDPVLDNLNAWTKTQTEMFEKERIEKKAEYESLFNTSLASIDATLQSTLQNINTTFDKRLEEQKRINALNVDRVKAYGLSGGGKYTPVMFRDAISDREIDASNKINELENQRNSLIAQAKSARDSGQSKLLAERLENLAKVDEQIRKNIENTKRIADEQYKLMRDIRKEEEAKHQENVKKILLNVKAYATQYADDFTNLDNTEKDNIIKELMKETGLSYGDIYMSFNEAVSEKTKTNLDLEKKKIDIERVKSGIKADKALETQRYASAQKSFSDIAKGGSNNTDKDFTTTEIKKLEQVGLSKADRQTKLDYLYGNEEEKQNALNSKNKTTNTTKVESKVKAQYEAKYNDGIPRFIPELANFNFGTSADDEKQKIKEINEALAEGYSIDEIVSAYGYSKEFVNTLKKAIINIK